MHKEIIGQTEFTFRNGVESRAILEDIYRLRYQVYCNECGFVREEDYPDQSETDKYDPYSEHFSIEDSDGVIGTLRLIKDNPYGFPFEERCKDRLDFDLNSLNRKRICEVSRLAISRHYRRRKDDGMYYTDGHVNKNGATGETGMEHAKRLKPMVFGIYREMYQDCKRHNLTHFFALMEKSLWLLLRMHHFVFQVIGEEIDFYGKVRPYMCSIEALEKNVIKKAPKFYDYFMNGLEKEFQPSLA